MNLTDELKTRLLTVDYGVAKRELECLDTLATRMKYLIEIGRPEDAYEWLGDAEHSMATIISMAKRKEAAETFLTTEQWLKRKEQMKSWL
ncbi:hypothetical protein NIE88_18650 [Sporolactobacillus shoreicorticis]|uniref:Phage protein n=1 Tax=Sporolactobacillus shoreicorticis TaxID=1923877 RepID=A0ABW5S5A9_9BACL|nr:hypothetical protein [Sporolactobacillus shoreicorticis]MCO7127769.1 hypothetical protein [Sporolactobacillus shoreicorticis]